MASSDRGVSSFGRRRPEEKVEDPTVLSVQLPPVKLTLEIDRDAMLTLGDTVRDVVYNAATAGLQAAVEDFAASQDGELDDQADDGPGDHVDDPQGPAQVTNTTGASEPLLTAEQLRQVGDTDSR